MPSGEEEASGTVISSDGRVYYSYWIAWDEPRRAPAFAEWREIEPEPWWMDNPSYREARRLAGVPNP